VTTPRDDYYDLLGVDPSAPTDEIRERYRERRSELEAQGTDDARNEAARLNRAWNVLSDPYQRGRYDATLEQSVETVDGDDVEVVDAAPPRRRRLFEPPPPRSDRAGNRDAGRGQGRDRGAARAPLPPVEYPNGLRAPENRRRVVAMVIDLLVILLMFVAAQFVLQAVIKDRFPAEVDKVNARSDCVNVLDKDKPVRADVVRECKGLGVSTTLLTDKTARDKKVKDLKDEIVEIQKKFTGTYYTVVGGFVLVALAYLVVPSALTGQTLGKRLQHVRAVRADGSPLGWFGALARYAPITILTGIFLPTPLGQIVFVVALVVILSWMRNANRQGYHDRLAKTIVVDAA
jgi:RDD family protein/DnaJ-like protein